MSPLLLAQLINGVLTYAPQAIGLVIQLKKDIDQAKTATTVSDADLAELARLLALTSDSIYARLGIESPPPKTA